MMGTDRRLLEDQAFDIEVGFRVMAKDRDEAIKKVRELLKNVDADTWIISTH